MSTSSSSSMATEKLEPSRSRAATEGGAEIWLSGGGAGPAAPVWARVGVPLPRGMVFDEAELALAEADGTPVRCQARCLARWPDRSLKWALVDLIAEAGPQAGRTLRLIRRPGPLPEALPQSLRISAEADEITIGVADTTYRLRRGTDSLLGVDIAGAAAVAPAGVQLRLRGEDGVEYRAQVERIAVEIDGPVRADVVAEGRFVGADSACPLIFRARWSFVALPGQVQCDLMIRNPRAARHVGGLWDLGDAGSWPISDLSLQLRPGFEPLHLDWQVEPSAPLHRADPGARVLYQDSSGGERWNSPNHVGADGSLGVSFQGYQVRAGIGAAAAVEAAGLRAQPSFAVVGSDCRIAVTVAGFWQNFPKALRWDGQTLSAALFPAEYKGSIELQGGEQKRHLIDLSILPAGDLPGGAETPRRAHATVDPHAVERSGAVSGFVTAIDDPQLTSWLDGIVSGERSFEARREIIDEYGWRHFGDLYADHEAVHSDPAVPFISHYNNQYDFVLGAGLHALRTADPRWLRLMNDSARHVVDIDVYHTDEDKPAFNGGLFWHTDHYVPAATATHRTYSRANAGSGDYGGGPSNEHNYASGLLLHHYMTGDAESREAVIGLADWVCAMDDGTRTLSGLLDGSPTGLASKTLDYDYHGPGRGAGNSISTLLDAYRLSRRRAYMDKAEELIQRCIHPADDIAARQLDEPERRWSYLVFLQVLGKYLDLKREYGETDYRFHYARASLLHYAEWMRANEQPYRDVAHKLEIPSETWSAHDARKCHVFHLAALHDDDAQRARAFRERADYFHRRWITDLAGFATQHLTRPMVLVSVYGHLHDYYTRSGERTCDGEQTHGGAYACSGEPADRSGSWTHDYDFGSPTPFVPQRQRLKAALRDRLDMAWRESRRLVHERISRLSARGRKRG